MGTLKLIDYCIHSDTIVCMSYIIQQTELFETWHNSIKDLRAKIAISRRIERAENGNMGDVKSIGDGVTEMRIDVGAGYRVYFAMRKKVLVIFG